jgi:hypothetical protein
MIDSIPAALKTTMATEKKIGPDVPPMNIAPISAGFEKGDFLVREEQGNRVYFDFFEEVRSRRAMYENAPLIERVLYAVCKALVSNSTN